MRERGVYGLLHSFAFYILQWIVHENTCCCVAICIGLEPVRLAIGKAHMILTCHNKGTPCTAAYYHVVQYV